MKLNSSPPFFRINNLGKTSSLAIFVIIASSIPESFSASEITLYTDKSSHTPGDVIEIHGQVLDSPNQLVAVEVKDHSGSTIMIRAIKTDSHGSFALKFKLPQTADSGSYNIIANTKMDGGTITNSKVITTASVVPEFPVNSEIVLFVAIISVISIATKFRTNWNH